MYVPKFKILCPINIYSGALLMSFSIISTTRLSSSEGHDSRASSGSESELESVFSPRAEFDKLMTQHSLEKAKPLSHYQWKKQHARSNPSPLFSSSSPGPGKLSEVHKKAVVESSSLFDTPGIKQLPKLELAIDLSKKNVPFSKKGDSDSSDYESDSEWQAIRVHTASPTSPSTPAEFPSSLSAELTPISMPRRKSPSCAEAKTLQEYLETILSDSQLPILRKARQKKFMQTIENFLSHQTKADLHPKYGLEGLRIGIAKDIRRMSVLVRGDVSPILSFPDSGVTINLFSISFNHFLKKGSVLFQKALKLCTADTTATLTLAIHPLFTNVSLPGGVEIHIKQLIDGGLKGVEAEKTIFEFYNNSENKNHLTLKVSHFSALLMMPHETVIGRIKSYLHYDLESSSDTAHLSWEICDPDNIAKNIASLIKKDEDELISQRKEDAEREKEKLPKPESSVSFLKRMKSFKQKSSLRLKQK